MANSIYPPDALWLSVSPHLKKFDQRLLCQLARYGSVRRWEYHQSPDEPCCLEVPVTLLHEYLSGADRPVHLLGHGLSGVVALLYARRFPSRVRSLTLLSVNVTPTVNWHAHYYALRQLLPCRREVILAQMVRLLFGPQGCAITQALVQVLAQDLDTGLSLHSLAAHRPMTPEAVRPPLLVCCGERDGILDRPDRWQAWLKPGDRRWQCPQGRHFFHFDQPKPVAQAIIDHWCSLPMTALPAAEAVVETL